MRRGFGWALLPIRSRARRKGCKCKIHRRERREASLHKFKTQETFS